VVVDGYDARGAVQSGVRHPRGDAGRDELLRVRAAQHVRDLVGVNSDSHGIQLFPEMTSACDRGTAQYRHITERGAFSLLPSCPLGRTRGGVSVLGAYPRSVAHSAPPVGYVHVTDSR